MKRAIKKDLIIILLWPIFAALLSIYLKVNYLLLVLLFYVIPATFVSLRNKKLIIKNILFSIIVGIPGTLIVDYLAEVGGAWSTTQTLFGFLIFGTTSIEDLLWGFFIIYFIITFFEYFIENRYKDKVSYPRMKYLFISASLILIIFSLLLIFNPNLLSWRYSFLKIGIFFFIIPPMFFVSKLHINIKKTIYAALYFFYLNFILEIVAVVLGIWKFPGEFIGWINILGIKFPIEELVFWIVLFSIGTLISYEFFDEPTYSKK